MDRVERLDIDLCVANPEEEGERRRKEAVAPPSLTEMLRQDDFVAGLLEGFSADSLAGFQVREGGREGGNISICE
jgi:hypothetical protein